jgi:lipopolysaccharide export system permease protein
MPDKTPTHWLLKPLSSMVRSRLFPGFVAIVGIDVLFIYIYQLIKAPISPDQVELYVLAAFPKAFPKAPLQLIYNFIEQSWIALVVCLLPAFLICIIRVRGLALLLPVGIASILAFSFWLYSDLHHYYGTAINSVQGEQPSYPAYIAKLVFIGASILSPPFFVRLYYGSSIMDRYVIRSLGTPFLLCLAAIVSIMIIMDLGDNGRDFMEAEASLPTVLQFYILQIPFMVVAVIDAALLLALLYALGKMSRSNEIVSMLGSGRSVLRLLAPLILVGAYCALVSLAFNYDWAPRAERLKDEMLQTLDEEDERSKRNKTDARNVAFKNTKDSRFWYMSRVPIDLTTGNKIRNIQIHEDNEDGSPGRQWYAKSASWESLGKSWFLYNGRYWEEPDSAGIPFDRLIIKGWTETPWLIQSNKIKPEYLGVRELASYLNTNAGFPERSLAKYRTTMHARFAVPFRCIVVVLIAAPLGIVYSRRGLLGGVAYAIFIFAAIFFLNSTFQKAGEGSYLAPFPAAWLANFIFAGVGAVLLYYRANNRDASALNPFKWLRRARASSFT